MKSQFRTVKNSTYRVISLSFFLLAVLTTGSTMFSLVASAQIAQESLGTSGGQYFVEFNKNGLPRNLSARINALGGTIVDATPEINVAMVGNMTDIAAAKLRAQPDVADVTEDYTAPSPDSGDLRRLRSLTNFSLQSAAHPELAHFYALQWDKRVIQADRAWAAGAGAP